MSDYEVSVSGEEIVLNLLPEPTYTVEVLESETVVEVTSQETVIEIEETEPTTIEITENNYEIDTEEVENVVIEVLQGQAGPQGPQGEKGDTGDTGPQGPQGPPGDDGQGINVEYITVNATHISEKRIELEQMPSDPSQILVDVVGGTTQHLDFDFIVDGDFLDWDGFGLETILSEGDVLRITYLI